MIENLRKYTGLMIVALIAVFVGLVLFVDTGLTRGRGGGRPFMRIGDRTYSVEEYQLLGERSLQVANRMQMYMMIGQLGGGNMWQPDPQQFFTNRMLLRQAQDEFGVHPSEEEILRYLRERSAFFDRTNNTFNQQAYNEFISREIGRYGLSENSVHDLVRDYLAYEKLSQLIGSGLLADRDYSRRAYADENQKLDLQLIEFPLAKYEGKIEPTEEEVKTFWEENKEAYKTEARRRFTYLVATPAGAAKPAPAEATPPSPPTNPTPAPTPTPAPPPAPTPAESTPPAPASETQPAPTPVAPAPGAPGDTGDPGTAGSPAAEPATPATPAVEPTAPATPAPPAVTPVNPVNPVTPPAPTPDPEAEKAAAAEAARKEAERKLAESVDTFLGELDQSEGADFEKLAKEYGWEIKTSEFFTRSSLPSDLNLPVRNSQPGRDLAFFLFDGLTVTSDPLSKFTPAIPVNEGGWVLARLDEEEASREKTFEEARAEARAALIQQRAIESLKKDSEAAVKTLREALAAGKDFATAAKESALEIKTFTDFTRPDFRSNRGPEGMPDPAAVFNAAARIDPGSLADPLHLPDRSLVIFVTQRKLVKEENLAGRIDGFATQEATRNGYVAFDAWLAAGRERSKMLIPQG